MITRARMDELFAFLPLLGTADERLEPRWLGIDDPPDEYSFRTLPFPEYPPTVKAFFRLASHPCWFDVSV